MTLEIKRLHLASLQGIDGGRWPVHGFVVTHPGGAVLVDTGVGGPQDALDDWRVVNRSVADALAEYDMSPADIGLVINTHLHFDHCGQNAVFKHAPFYVQRAELSRMRRESARTLRLVRLRQRAVRVARRGRGGAARPGGDRHARAHRGPPVRRGARRPRRVRPADRRCGLHAAAVRRTRQRQASGRPAARPATWRPGATRYGGSIRCDPNGCISATTPISCTAELSEALRAWPTAKTE